MQQVQLKIGDKIKLYGFGLLGSPEGAFGFFDGEPATVKDLPEKNPMMTVFLTQTSTEAQVHFFQAIPSEREKLF